MRSLLRFTFHILLLLSLILAGYLMTQIVYGAGTKAVDDAQEIVVEARQFAYQPGVIRVAEGQRVRLTLKAMDVTHGLYVDDYGQEVHATPGRPEQLEFVANKAGQFRIRCTQTCGLAHPFMVGKLVVEPNTPLQFGLGLLGLGAVGSVALLGLRRLAPRPSSGASALTLMQVGEGSSPRRKSVLKVDLLRVQLIDRLLRWRGFQFAITLPFLAFLTFVVVAGLLGTPIGSHNAAIVFVWIVWWPLLITVLIPLGGRLWCAVCPLPSPGEWLQRRAFIGKHSGSLMTLGRRWPAALRNMWLQNAAFVLIALFSVVILTRPLATVAVLSVFFALGLLLALVYSGRVFCRYVCPLGGFIGLCSLVAPLAIRVKDGELCRQHRQKACIRGSSAGYGCPWFEYPGTMNRNAYCGLCMECLKTCDQHNVTVGLQPFASDLLAGKPRLDEAFRTFIALASAGVYAAVMLGPWGWLKTLAGDPLSPNFALWAVILLGASIVVVPLLFLIVAYFARLASGASQVSTAKLWQTFSYGAVPLALMAWIAFSLSIVFASGHYVVSVISDPLGHGWNIFGTAAVEGGPMLMQLLPGLQIGALVIGLVWSIRVSWRLAVANFAGHAQAWRAMWPITGFLSLAAASLLWLYIG